MPRLVQPKFDPAADFTVTRDLLFAGRQYAPGQTFDKSLVDQRRLRQLTEVTRQLRQEATPTVAKPAAGVVRRRLKG